MKAGEPAAANRRLPPPAAGARWDRRGGGWTVQGGQEFVSQSSVSRAARWGRAAHGGHHACALRRARARRSPFPERLGEEHPLGEIELYVGENENPSNQKQVASVEVELRELKPLAPLRFVDTPGLGSAFAHNTEAAMNWLPNVGAALVAVGADAPLSERDLALLDELHRHAPKIVLLLTKADLLTEAQRDEVRDFVAARLQPKRNGKLPVFFYSIKPEIAAMRRALLAELLEPLREQRHEAGRQILRHKVASLRDQALN
jgi:GTP-binding protein EngB required for normal cell division